MSEITDLSQQLGKTAVKSLLSLIPGVGPVVAEVFSAVFDIEVNKRTMNIIIDLGRRLQALEDHNILKVHELPNNEIFIDVTLEAVNLARKTSNKTKIRAFQNTVLNTACNQHPTEFYTHTFLQLLDRFTHLHLAVLNVAGHTMMWFVKHDIPWVDKFGGADLWRIELMLCAAIPEIDSPFMVDTIWKDLQLYGLIDDTPVDKVFQKETDLYESRLTLTGMLFCQFIDDPKHLD